MYRLWSPPKHEACASLMPIFCCTAGMCEGEQNPAVEVQEVMLGSSLCRDLYHCKPVILLGDESEEEQKHYIEMTPKAQWPEAHTTPRPLDLAYKRPKVRCDSREIAHKVRQAKAFSTSYLLRLVVCPPKDTGAPQEAH